MGRAHGARALSREPLPRHPRRVSGPVARPVPVPGRPRPAIPAAQPHTIGAKVRALPDHRLLDTLLRSRAWIWLLGIALGGIVFMQVSLLGMNAGIGENVQKAEDLQHSNAALQEQIAEASGLDRVRAQATKLGLISPDAGQVGYLRTRPGDARRGAAKMSAPSEEARQTLATDGRDPATVAAAATPTTATTTTTTAATVPTAVPTAVATAVVTAVATPVYTATPPATTTSTTTPPTTATSGATTAP